MKLLDVISILLVFASTGLAEDLIFFADDHYKSLGRPEIVACVATPVLLPEDSILRVSLANAGELRELIPINESGSNDDIFQEMMAETKSCDALNINAVLGGTPAIKVASAQQNIDVLPAGSATMLQFHIITQKNASGWYSLPLSVEYERQVDVSVKSGEVFPLYEAERQNITCDVFVSGFNQTLHISGIKSQLYPGGQGSIRMIIGNDGATTLYNCSAGLLAAPPLYVESPTVLLGDLDPGSLHVMEFEVRADGNASLHDYQLACEILCQEKSIIVPLQVSLSEVGFLGTFSRPEYVLGGLAVAGLAAFLIWWRGDRKLGRKRRRW
ncbi:MAG: hypothetical protein A4E49_01463 [Methanosaeta sp. PtaU1.Bin112]|nr:MAG: hypothetical protein A4E49_01463 [Methanosaeta sp. PtaU1.Bin112]